MHLIIIICTLSAKIRWVDILIHPLDFFLNFYSPGTTVLDITLKARKKKCICQLVNLSGIYPQRNENPLDQNYGERTLQIYPNNSILFALFF